jgi:hypothetical protein
MDNPLEKIAAPCQIQSGSLHRMGSADIGGQQIFSRFINSLELF